MREHKTNGIFQSINGIGRLVKFINYLTNCISRLINGIERLIDVINFQINCMFLLLMALSVNYWHSWMVLDAACGRWMPIESLVLGSPWKSSEARGKEI